MKHALFIPYVNRRDLLDKAILSAMPAFPDLILIDNSPAGELAGLPHEILTPPVPLSCTQTLNWMKREAVRRQCEAFFWLHNDAEIPPGVGEGLLVVVERTLASEEQWGVIFTNYDAFCAFNTAAVVAVGDWDQNLTQYFCDNDYYHRLRQAGYPTIGTGLHVHHVASATLNSDPLRQMANRYFFPAAQAYCREKHGEGV